MLRILKFAVVPVITAVMIASPVLAASGQIEGGDIYWAKNVTANGSYVDPASANAGDTLSFRVRIHNPGEVCLTNVNVKAVLPSGSNTAHTSTVTIWADNATTNYISDTATVNLSSSQSFTYVPGSAQLLDNSGVTGNLSDSIVTTGVNIGNVCVSVGNQRFVQFQAKVSVPANPTPTPAPVKPVAAKGAAPEKLPSTGPGAVASLFAGASALGAAGHYIVSRKRQ